MKPDWKDAPEWANWLAMDESGEWYWYEREPIKHELRFWHDPNLNGMFERVEKFILWEDSKEKRP